MPGCLRLIQLGSWYVTTAILLVSTAGAARGDDDQFGPVRERIAKALVDHSIPSLSVAVAHQGKIVWEQGFGWADREGRVLASEHTLYSVASVSKPVTATGLMVLVDRKQIDLDHPANEYLGDAKLRAHVGDAAGATVRRVANHTSGLPLHYQFFYADESFHPPTRDETIRRFGNLVTEPGEHYQYSNLGFGVLDYIIERSGGKPFADFMREEVFLPLGMTHTSIGIGAGLEPHQAIRYTSGGQRIPFYEFDHDGASAVYASAHDLARFGMFHMKEHLADQKAILKDDSIDEMQKPTAITPNGAGYGVGWGSADTPRGYHTIEHSGGMPGVSTLCTLVPSERLAIVVLSNSNNMFPSVISKMIEKILLPERKSEATAASKDKSESGAYKPFAPGSELLGTWKGRLVTYRGELPVVLVVKESADVHLRIARQLEALVNGPSLKDGFLHGRFLGDLGTDDHRGRPYQLHLDLKLRGEILNGAVTATTLPDKWGSSAVTHWLELAREPSDGETKPSTATGEGGR